MICEAINEDWPYTVQSKLEDNRALAFGVHFASLFVFVAIYFVFRAIHMRYWKPPGWLSPSCDRG